MTAAAGAKPTVFLRDYRAPAWRVRDVELVFDLDPVETIVAARLAVEADPDRPGTPLRLDGEGLELIELRVDGRALAAGEYMLDADALTIPGLSHAAIVETRARIAPERNTALQGLYLSGDRDSGFLLTQCEAEGFRRITWFVDRPDVLARYVGTYELAPKLSLEVTLKDGALWVHPTDQPTSQLWPETEHDFFLKDIDAQFTFVQDSTGAVTSVILHQGGRDLPAKKVQ